VTTPPLNKADAAARRSRWPSIVTPSSAAYSRVCRPRPHRSSRRCFKAYYQAGVCDVCDKPDVARAKTLAASGGIPPGTKVKLAFNTGAGHDAWVQAIQQQLQDNLGLKVELPARPFKEMLKNESAKDASGLWRAAWSADYPSAENFLFPLLSKKSLPPGDNRAGTTTPSSTTFSSRLVRRPTTPNGPSSSSRPRRSPSATTWRSCPLVPRQYRVFDGGKWRNVAIDFNENPTLSVIGLK